MSKSRRQAIKLAAVSGTALVSGVSLSNTAAASHDNKIDGNSDKISGPGYEIETSLGVAGSTKTETGQARTDASWAVDIKENSGRIEITPELHVIPIYDTEHAYADPTIPYQKDAGGSDIDKLGKIALEIALSQLDSSWIMSLIPEEDPSISISPFYDGFKLTYPSRTNKYSEEKHTGGIKFEVNSEKNDIVKKFEVATSIDVEWTPVPAGPRSNDSSNHTLGTYVWWDVQF